ncbi:LPXTG cell wall anchor domain-containing protein [Duganella sp. LX20W]|uniref:LPXTG cell wall anchor domain-containing protein n=1 Tax=Rugamonas brunnea TaxID=2758569 RepID=A0A7W2EQY9_9BURK|nr:LPXTG cell wall anchor domain-containing protein [Rugamonas brunnea]MBA5637021.1 LPXTG cell wall anchor domain-containing protein [Rugamonas brunnea]
MTDLNMQRKPRLVSTLCALACAASLAPAIHAAELGEASVRSFIGQQLAADIELVSLTPDEVTGLQVRLAPVDVYQGASITMNPALATIHLSVVRRDQRQFLHITTLKPIDANYVHLFLELGVPGRTDVRAATLWLQPDPHPAPQPAPVVAAASGSATATVAPQSAGAAVTELEAAAEASLRAARARGARPATAAGGAPAHPPHPAASGTGDGGAMVEAPTEPARASGARRRAALVPPATQGQSGAACAPQTSRLSARECAALDHRSAALTEKLVALEDKVKVLQTALDSKGTPDSKAAIGGKAATEGKAVNDGKAGADGKAGTDGKPASDNKAAADGKPLRAHVPPRAGASRPASTRLKYKKEPPVETGPDLTTMLAAGGAVLLALAGGVYYWMRRRKQGGEARAPLKIWQGWRRKKGEEAAPDDAQPEKDALNQAE